MGHQKELIEIAPDEEDDEERPKNTLGEGIDIRIDERIIYLLKQNSPVAGIRKRLHINNIKKEPIEQKNIRDHNCDHLRTITAKVESSSHFNDHVIMNRSNDISRRKSARRSRKPSRSKSTNVRKTRTLSYTWNSYLPTISASLNI